MFLNLFMRKEYQLMLYKELFPQDTTIGRIRIFFHIPGAMNLAHGTAGMLGRSM